MEDQMWKYKGGAKEKSHHRPPSSWVPMSKPGAAKCSSAKFPCAAAS
jgi:hypothetical protein